MSVDNAFRLYNVGVGVLATPTMIAGNTRVAFNTDPRFRADRTGNRVDPRIAAIVEQQAQGSFSTRAIGLALDNIALDGYQIAGGTPAKYFVMFLAKTTTGVTTLSGAVHNRYSATKGIIVLRELTVGAIHLEDALINYDYYLCTDGATDPVTKAESESLPTDAADVQRYTLGPQTVCGYTMTGLRRMTIAFNPTVQLEQADNDTFPTLAYLAGRNIQITFIGVDPDWFKAANIPLGGKTAAHADTTLFLRKWEEDGAGFVADGTAEHVAFTASGVAAISQPFTVEVDGISETAVTMQCADDGTNGALTIDTASVIS